MQFSGLCEGILIADLAFLADLCISVRAPLLIDILKGVIFPFQGSAICIKQIQCFHGLSTGCVCLKQLSSTIHGCPWLRPIAREFVYRSAPFGTPACAVLNRGQTSDLPLAAKITESRTIGNFPVTSCANQNKNLLYRRTLTNLHRRWYNLVVQTSLHLLCKLVHHSR